MESDLTGLHFSVFHIHLTINLRHNIFYLISNQHDGNVFANSGEIFMPLGNIFISDSGSDIEHDNCAVSPNAFNKDKLLVSFSESSQFLLSCGVPEVEFDRPVVGVEGDAVHLHPLGRNVFLLELTGQVTFHKGSLSHSSITHHYQFEFSNRSH